MARANPPPQQVPQALARDPETFKYFQAMTRSLFDIWTRTGAGLDQVQAAVEEATSASGSLITSTHPGVAKAWAKITYAGGVPSTAASHNVDSVIDDGTGLLTLVWSTAFGSADYAVIVSMDSAGGDVDASVVASLQVAESVRISIRASGSNVDNTAFVAAFGDQ